MGITRKTIFKAVCGVSCAAALILGGFAVAPNMPHFRSASQVSAIESTEGIPVTPQLSPASIEGSAAVDAEVAANAAAAQAAAVQAAADAAAQAAAAAAQAAQAAAAPSPVKAAVTTKAVAAGPVHCPAGSQANSSDGENDTSCFPVKCFTMTVDPADPNSAECITAFKP